MSITGAASGIGAESARRFAEEGARVVGVDMSADSEGELAIECDVTHEHEVEALYARVHEEMGGIDVLFNNAGINPSADTTRHRDDARGLAARPGRERALRLSVLQARHPASGRAWGRLGHQHRLVRRGHGRRRLADLLHGVEGRGALALARAGGRVRRSRRSRERAVPRASQHAAAARAVRQGPRATPRSASSTCRWAASARSRRSRTPPFS